MPGLSPEAEAISADEMGELGSSFLDPAPDVLEQFLVLFVLKDIADPVSEESTATADPEETKE